jgi:hypothetical protein
MAAGNWTGETGAAGDDYVSETGVGAGAVKVDYTVKHPNSSYNTMYPYNKTWQTESGHLMEWDDTPSAERIRKFHKSGSYNEHNFQGTHVGMTAGDHFHYHKGGHTKTTDQNHDEKLGGHHREVKTGDHYTEHNGSKYESTIGDHINAHKGSLCTMTGGNSWTKVYGDNTHKIDGDHNHSCAGNTSIKSNGESLINSVGGDHTTNASNSYNNFAGANILHTAQGTYTLTATSYTATASPYTINGNVIINGNLTVTGIKNFLEPHPTDPTKEIAYSALEGGEAGTYLRGTATLICGGAQITLPEHFALVTEPEDLTIQFTPRDTWLQLYVVKLTTTHFVIKEAQNRSGTFDYFIQGTRKGYAQKEVIREKTTNVSFKEYVYRGHTYVGLDE